MDHKQLESICSQVYQRFPEVKGVQPKISTPGDSQTLLIFSGKATTADGKTITRNVRVVVGPTGKIVKMTTSR
jgi:hypothetical protein